MHYIVAITPVNPLRASPSHRAEMVSQMLFGETAQVLDQSEDFLNVKTTFDGYEGWIQKSQVMDVSKKFFRKKIKGISTENRTIFFNGEAMALPIGAPVWNTMHFEHTGIKYGRVPTNAGLHFSAENIELAAKKYINAPYLWGGRTAWGCDCSGFTQQVFRMLHISLPRDASQQAQLGEVIGFLPEVACGDLAFFDNSQGLITHVGILLNAHTIIHASGKVRIDKVDTEGIINVDTGSRTHHLRMIKRIK